MKRIFYTLFLVSGLSFAVSAQAVTANQNANLTIQADPQHDEISVSGLKYEQVKATVKSCHELDMQLQTVFGREFSFNDPKVIDLLKRNITDNTASVCIRKSSLYLVYGEKYTDHLDLINIKTKQ